MAENTVLRQKVTELEKMVAEQTMQIEWSNARERKALRLCGSATTKTGGTGRQ